MPVVVGWRVACSVLQSRDERDRERESATPRERERERERERMDLTLIQDAFDRVSKKQKVCYTKTQDVIDRTLHELEVAAKQLSETSTDQKLVLTGLQGKLAELAPSNQVQCCHFTHTHLLQGHLAIFPLWNFVSVWLAYYCCCHCAGAGVLPLQLLFVAWPLSDFRLYCFAEMSMESICFLLF